MFSPSGNILVLDLETQKSFKEVGGKANLARLKVSVAGVYDFLTDEYRTYEEKDLMALDKRLQDMPLLVGFNIRGFDLPVLAPYIFRPIEDLAVIDLLDDIEKARGHRVSLESVAAPTLKQHKSGHGAEAINLFREGRLAELKQYCLDDVRLTREIFEHGCREGKILFTSTWDYKTYEVAVSWAEEAERVLAARAARGKSFPTSLF
jgi:DEAD/DEAH box helicase domain-containing protein